MASTRSPAVSPRAAQDRSVGRLLGERYRVLSRLGEGGMGTVYLCEHAVLGRRFAVKVLRPDLARDAELVERFRNEAIAASGIGQENVVDVLDFGAEQDGTLYYVMEALEGRSLRAVLSEEGPLAVHRALALLEQIGRALAAAHARGVVHRDVKPENVFVVRRDDGSERAKVIDFGVSDVPLDGALGNRAGRAGEIVGTPEYMAPEQAAGEPVDPRADVYAMGVLAFEMLTGTLPFLADSAVAVLLAHRTRVPDAPSRRHAGIPPEVDDLVLRALAKRREERHPTMEALADAAGRIRAAVAAAGVTTARELAAVEAAGSAGPRRRAAYAALAVVAACAAFGWWWRGEAEAVAAVTATSTPTSTTTPNTTSTSTPTPTPTSTSTRTSTPTRRRAAPPARQQHVADPYAATALKPDPFE